MNCSRFAVPVENCYLEDYEPGSVHQFGAVKIEEANQNHDVVMSMKAVNLLLYRQAT